MINKQKYEKIVQIMLTFKNLVLIIEVQYKIFILLGGVFMKNERLIEARKQKKLNQTQLAQMLGFRGKQSVANWENGHSTPTLETAIKISEILDKDLIYLFGRKVQDSQTNQDQEAI